ncbi:MAG TPA: HEAT repeat domain-containing protein [Burkholderiales bacterium]|nr:HEAT repeat domain-containing protein [Burkholderiales bacterium]
MTNLFFHYPDMKRIRDQPSAQAPRITPIEQANVADAACALDALENVTGILTLVNALRNEDANVRKAAASSLRRYKRPESGAILLAHTNHPEASVRALVLRALLELQVVESFELALAALDDSDGEVRREAVTVLGHLGRRAALGALIKLTAHDPEPEVRRAAIDALSFATDAEALPALLASLRDKSCRVREEAAIMLGKLRLQEAADDLIARLQDSSWQVALYACRSLGILRSALATPALTHMLGHQISNLRKEAAWALGEIRSSSALPALAAIQDDVDPDVRKAVRLAIRQIRNALA